VTALTLINLPPIQQQAETNSYQSEDKTLQNTILNKFQICEISIYIFYCAACNASTE